MASAHVIFRQRLRATVSREQKWTHNCKSDMPLLKERFNVLLLKLLKEAKFENVLIA